jgi:hypothetical protein
VPAEYLCNQSDITIHIALAHNTLKEKEHERWVIAEFGFCEAFDVAVLPLFRVLVEPVSMAAASMWFIDAVL